MTNGDAEDLTLVLRNVASELTDSPARLRDQFAAAALQGMLACLTETPDWAPAEALARKAFEYADAMIAARVAP